MPATPATKDNEDGPADAAATSTTPHLVFCGSTKWDLIGRKSLPKSVLARGGTAAGEDLLGPTRLRFAGLPGAAFASVFSGNSAAHLVLVDAAGAAYGLGRNDAAQLARADLRARRHPVRLALPSAEPGERVVHAACGRAHTLLVTSAGRALAVGTNVFGQLGIGSRTDLKNPQVPALSVVQLPPGEKAVCAGAGSDFSALACASGAVYCMGSGQYGQLGNGRTGECIETGNRIAFDVITKPLRVPGFGDGDGEVAVTQIACGSNHTVALDKNGKVWSWGFGGYGRLGHKTPKDELRPRRVEAFASPNYSLDIVACGQQSSFASQKNRKSCYMWGMTKRTGECNMYPKPQFDLQGWEIRSMASGTTSTVVSAEKSVISWGCSPTFGELGYGEGKPKSSTKPKVMDSLEGLVASQLTEGLAFTAMIVSIAGEDDQKILDKLPVLEVEGHVEDDDAQDAAAGDKRKDKSNGEGKKKSKKRRR